MKRAGYDVRENDPFVPAWTFETLGLVQPPIVDPLQTMWGAFRESIIQEIPRARDLPEDTDAYLSFVDDIYRNDAYHSLSIEGYRVTYTNWSKGCAQANGVRTGKVVTDKTGTHLRRAVIGRRFNLSGKLSAK